MMAQDVYSDFRSIYIDCNNMPIDTGICCYRPILGERVNYMEIAIAACIIWLMSLELRVYHLNKCLHEKQNNEN